MFNMSTTLKPKPKPTEIIDLYSSSSDDSDDDDATKKATRRMPAQDEIINLLSFDDDNNNSNNDRNEDEEDDEDEDEDEIDATARDGPDAVTKDTNSDNIRGTMGSTGGDHTTDNVLKFNLFNDLVNQPERCHKNDNVKHAFRTKDAVENLSYGEEGSENEENITYKNDCSADIETMTDIENDHVSPKKKQAAGFSAAFDPETTVTDVFLPPSTGADSIYCASNNEIAHSSNDEPFDIFQHLVDERNCDTQRAFVMSHLTDDDVKSVQLSLDTLMINTDMFLDTIELVTTMKHLLYKWHGNDNVVVACAAILKTIAGNHVETWEMIHCMVSFYILDFKDHPNTIVLDEVLEFIKSSQEGK
jgi:hypothetical protein